MRAIRKVLASIHNADTRFSLINSGDKIIVGVSGGKDSLVLTYALNLYRKFAQSEFEIIPVMLDLGFPTFDPEPVRAYLENIGLTLYVADAKNVYSILQAHTREGAHLPCSICSRMKKATINKVAHHLGVTKVAFAHHAEDAIETLFMNEIYGGRIATFSPKMHFEKTDIDFIRPLILTREKDIIRCAAEEKLPVLASPCPSDGLTTREDIKNMLIDIYEDYPDAKENFLTMLSNYEQEDLWGKQVFYKIEGTSLSLKPVLTKADALAMVEIRTAVFLIEQSVPPRDEFDGSDEGQNHLLIYKENTPIGTIRYDFEKPHLVHLSRIATLKEYRGQGYTKQAMQSLMDRLVAKVMPLTFILDAQTQALGFYEKLGFKKEGDEFLDADIPHFHMRLKRDI
ncbi:MAG: GNAT family N-acetyltransferase [Bacilli bacterium]|jgi:tRNA(Ile)-lysidine synthase TilS/MesJ/predicted N-acetyltransferase YhbS